MERCGDGSFAEWDGHTCARNLASCLFDVSFVAVAKLSPETLAGADLVVVHTTSAQQALSTDERAALSSFLNEGGTALLNCFSNWTNNGGWGQEPVECLGIQTNRSSTFGHRRVCRIQTISGLGLCEAGPLQEAPLPDWADVLSKFQDLVRHNNQFPLDFVNQGETEFDVASPVTHGYAVPVLDVRQLRPSEQDIKKGCGRLVWFGSCCQGGKGQALVCSNMHWLADRHAWNGGMISMGANWRLWLNLCAAACRGLQDHSPSAKAR